MERGKRGSHLGVSLGLRISLLLILGTIGEECNAAPRNDAQLHRTSLDEIKINGSSQTVGKQVSHSRRQRSIEEAVIRLLGYEFLRQWNDNSSDENITKPYPDGKLCSSGRDPPMRTKGEIKTFRELFDKVSKNVTGYSFYIVYNLDAYEELNKNPESNCKSKVCTFNLKEFYSVCGPLPPQNFTDGRSCIDGTKPMSEDEFADSGLLKLNGLSKGAKIHPDQVEEENKKAQRRYGKRCASGKCHYAFLRGGYICGSVPPKLKPSLLLSILALALPAFSLLRLSVKTDLKIQMETPQN